MIEQLTWKTEQRKISELVPLDKNPFGIITSKKRKRLQDKIQRLGIFEIPTIDLNNDLLTFNKRRHILVAMGKEDELIDVRIPNRSLTKEERKEIILASNIHEGEWDKMVLETEFNDIDIESIGIDVQELGIDQEEAKLKINECETDRKILLKNTSISELNDLYELESLDKGLCHRLLCGDSTRAELVIKLLNGVKVALMVTDPPYGVLYDPKWRLKARNGKIANTGTVKNDDIVDWNEAYILFDADVAYVWHAGRYAAQVQLSLEKCDYEIISQVIWNKHSLVMSRGDYHWKHEPCWYAVKKGKKHNWQGSRDQSTVWDIRNLTAASVIEKEGQTGHGTQKPIDCMRRPIINNSKEHDAVGDPFLGSGTTLIACELTRRNCYGQELDPCYVDVIVKRWVLYMQDNGLKYQVKRNGNLLSEQELLNF